MLKPSSIAAISSIDQTFKLSDPSTPLRSSRQIQFSSSPKTTQSRTQFCKGNIFPNSILKQSLSNNHTFKIYMLVRPPSPPVSPENKIKDAKKLKGFSRYISSFLRFFYGVCFFPASPIRIHSQLSLRIFFSIRHYRK